MAKRLPETGGEVSDFVAEVISNQETVARIQNKYLKKIEKNFTMKGMKGKRIS